MTKKTNLTLLFLAFFSGVFAQGDLLITPTRVVFEGRKQRENMNINNIGKDTAVYLVSFLNYRMQPDGSFKQVGNADTLTNRADPYLRIFPRRVVLPPGESQVVMLQFRKPSGMKDGEYRSHLYFRADKHTAPLGMEDSDRDSTRLEVRLTPIFGISIPVIIRTGNPALQLSLSDLALETLNDSTCRLTVAINRSGEMSSYGTIKVDYVPENGKTEEIGIANGVGVYTELEKRIFSMAIRPQKGIRLINGKLLVRYLGPKEDGSKEFARAEYLLPEE
ncbi:fimbrial biogenesis chaperone [Gaoshiqia sp. Z1-71]|uniref:fimbrial biogenesis chaperone n=1 Tax=Gaoshiqia hydrogeniformans TaxID=3290090 RepID=UPI003BF90C20